MVTRAEVVNEDAANVIEAARMGLASEKDARYLRWVIGESRMNKDIHKVLTKIAEGRISVTKEESNLLRQAI